MRGHKHAEWTSRLELFFQVLVRGLGVVGVDGGVLVKLQLRKVNVSRRTEDELPRNGSAPGHEWVRPASFHARRGRLGSLHLLEYAQNLAFLKAHRSLLSLRNDVVHQLFPHGEWNLDVINRGEELEDFAAVRLGPVEFRGVQLIAGARPPVIAGQSVDGGSENGDAFRGLASAREDIPGFGVLAGKGADHSSVVRPRERVNRFPIGEVVHGRTDDPQSFVLGRVGGDNPVGGIGAEAIVVVPSRLQFFANGIAQNAGGAAGVN